MKVDFFQAATVPKCDWIDISTRVKETAVQTQNLDGRSVRV